MQSIKRRDTLIELRVRSQLHRRGLRFRVDFAPLNPRRRADIVFTRVHMAIFLDGCFWHGCPLHYVAPKSNKAYWSQKVLRNMGRDFETDTSLKAAGWTVLRFWAHDDAESIATAIDAAIRERWAAIEVFG